MKNRLRKLLGTPYIQIIALSVLLVLGSLLVSGGALFPTPALYLGELPAPTSPDNPFSLVAMQKRLPPEAIRRVQRFIYYYQVEHKIGFEGSLARSNRYIELFRHIFHEQGMPEELAFLPLIESGFNEHAVSPAKAVGVWQFMEATGTRFDLLSTPWTDAKRDPIQSTKAASRYLRHLYNMFGNWELALAAYNSGEGTVMRAIRENKKAHLPTHYWALDLPDETRGYVPAFLAAVIIAKNPAAFGFHRVPFAPKLAYDQIKVQPGTSLSSLASQLNIDMEELLELNPELLTGIVPPGKGAYLLKVPKGLRANQTRKVG